MFPQFHRGRQNIPVSECMTEENSKAEEILFTKETYTSDRVKVDQDDLWGLREEFLLLFHQL